MAVSEHSKYIIQLEKAKNISFLGIIYLAFPLPLTFQVLWVFLCLVTCHFWTWKTWTRVSSVSVSGMGISSVSFLALAPASSWTPTPRSKKPSRRRNSAVDQTFSPEHSFRKERWVRSTFKFRWWDDKATRLDGAQEQLGLSGLSYALCREILQVNFF